MSEISVIGFLDEESEAAFVRRISEATLETLLTLHSQSGKPGKSADAAIDERAIVVRVCRLKFPRQQFGAPSRDFAAVYCLNAAAARMCEDLDINLPILGTLAAIPDELSYDLEAYYLPLERE